MAAEMLKKGKQSSSRGDVYNDKAKPQPALSPGAGEGPLLKSTSLLSNARSMVSPDTTVLCKEA